MSDVEKDGSAPGYGYGPGGGTPQPAQPAGHGYGYNYGHGYAPPPGSPPGGWGPGAPAGFRVADPGRAARVIAVVLFGLDAIANAFDLLRGDNALRDPVDLVTTAVLVLAAAATAAMLLPRRTRDFAAGAALAQVLTESARFLFSVRPSVFDELTWAGKISDTGSYILTALGGIVVAIAMIRERRVARPGGRRPIPALALGIPGAVCAVLGLVLTDYTWFYPGDPTPEPCCSWSVGDGFSQISDVLTAVALVACLLLLLLVTRPGFAVGVFAGVAVFQATDAVITLLEAVSPNASVYGFGAQTPSAQMITSHPAAGLWLSLVSLVLFVVCCFAQGGGLSGLASPGRPGGPYAAGFAATPYQDAAGYPQPQQAYLPPPAQPGGPGWQQYPPPGYPQPADPRSSHPQATYPQPGYPQAGYPQAGHPQPGPSQPQPGAAPQQRQQERQQEAAPEQAADTPPFEPPQ